MDKSSETESAVVVVGGWEKGRLESDCSWIILGGGDEDVLELGKWGWLHSFVNV